MSASAPIDILIAGHVRCVRCDAPMGKCDCWTKRVTLRCSICPRLKSVPPDASDPPGTAIVESVCDECDTGGLKPETHYYDAQGRWFDGEKFR